jgi:hypothetical protein
VTRQLSALVMIAALVTSPGTAQAATVLPLTPPPPDIAQLVPFAEAPIEKPSIAVADLPLPPSPSELPALPLAPIVAPAAPKPTATNTSPRASSTTPSRTSRLPCVTARSVTS